MTRLERIIAEDAASKPSPARAVVEAIAAAVAILAATWLLLYCLTVQIWEDGPLTSETVAGRAAE